MSIHPSSSYLSLLEVLSSGPTLLLIVPAMQTQEKVVILAELLPPYVL